MAAATTLDPGVSGNRNRTAVMAELRRLLPGIEGLRTAFPFSLAAIDSHLPDGGLAGGALHEVVPEAQACLPAAFGFIAALLAGFSSPPGEGSRGKAARPAGTSSPPFFPPPGVSLSRATPLVFVMPRYGFREYGRPYAHGLNSIGLDPRRLILVETTDRKQTLWAMEEALRSAAPHAVAGIIDKLDLKTSQRL